MSASVIVPVYNGAHVLPTTVPHVLALDGVDEWVWVDDGSTDDTEVVLRDLLADAPRACIVRQPENRGRSAARNRGVQETTGSTLLFFDCDVRPPHPTARQLVAALGEGAVASVARIRPMLGERTDPYAAYLSRHPRGPAAPTLVGHPIPWRYFLAGACAIERAALEDAGGFDEGIEYGEDFALACNLASRHPQGLALSAASVDLFDNGDLSQALDNVQHFGRALLRIERRCPYALEIAGLEGKVRSPLLGWLSSFSVPSKMHDVLGALPAWVQARAVRYLLGHALLAAYRGARDLTP